MVSKLFVMVFLSVLLAPCSLLAAIAPTTYQVTLVTTKAADVELKASAANTALTEAELATQNRIDAAQAEVAAWVAYDVAKQAAQSALLELQGIAETMYDTHEAEELPLPLPPGEPEPDPAPADE